MDVNFFPIIEVIGLVAGIAYVVGAILEKNWCWYFGIIATITYGISTYFYQLYGEFALQFFYLAMSFYGLNQWNKTDKEDVLSIENDNLIISWSSTSFLIKNIVFASLLSSIIYIVLVYFNGTFQFWDAITTGFGIMATYLTAKKKIENWIFWILIDIILSIVLYLKGMPFYSVLYILYTAFAVLGFYKWNKEIKTSFA